MIYADYAATTPLDPRVMHEMEPFFRAQFYNPSSLYPEARAVLAALDKARQSVAASAGANEGNLIFTSGGTESDNLALIGTALHPQNKKRHIITTAIEHHAVLESCRWLEAQGFHVTYLPVDEFGRVSAASLTAALTDDTLLVSVMWVNNELGTVQDIEALARLAHERGALFHTDAVQAMTTQDVNMERSGADLISISSHKFYGPKGCGALLIRDNVPLAPLLHGGQQERRLRGGTENTPAIVGMGAAARLLTEEKNLGISNMQRWKTILLGAFSALPDIRINSPISGSSPSVLHLALRGVEAEGLVFWLAREGIQVSMGSACNTQSVEPSHVVRAIGLPEDYARGCVRLSFGRGLDDGKITQLANSFIQIANKLRK